MFFLAFEVKEMPWLWASISLAVLFLVLIGIFSGTSRIVKELEINNTSFVLHFLFRKPVEYQFNDLRQYATASFGTGRSGLFHSVVLEFIDGQRFQIASAIIENYMSFLEFMRNGAFEFYGFIGQNNWRRNKSLSKKWVVARNEKDQEKEIGKNKGMTFFYIIGFFILTMNIVMLRYLIIYA